VRSELTQAERDYLGEPGRFGVLATINKDGTPQLTTMWYLLEGDEILFNTAVGRLKDRNLRRDPRVAFTIEDGYRYITVSGSVRRIEDQPTAQADIKRLASAYWGGEQIEERYHRTFARQQRVSYRLRIERVASKDFA
jgi:PPOX class probable F420-dependent enzyme